MISLILAIISPIVGVGWLIFVILYAHKTDDETTLALAIFSVLPIILFPIFLKDYLYDIEEYNVLVANILSIKQDNGVYGHFALGSGTVQDVQYYFYYYNTDKGIKLGKVKSDESYIIETDEYEPSVYKIKEKWEDAYFNIYVPYDTVVREFHL